MSKVEMLGKRAFDFYNESRVGLNYQSNKTPDWVDLPDGIRAAWEAAAHSAAEALICEVFDGPKSTLIEALTAVCGIYHVEIVIGEQQDGTNFSFNVRDRHEQG